MRVLAKATGCLLLMGALGSCGGESVCVQICDRIHDQLTTDFGAQVDCSDAKWQDADTCPKCTQVLEKDYGIAPTEPLPECS